MLANHATVIDIVNALMTKLRFTLSSARLRRVAPIDVLRLNMVEDHEVAVLLVTLEDLNSITLALQGEECSLLDVRAREQKAKF
ncbi:hypothetical protein H257_13414 [Aphanomyces astaci]|uniref:Uncharacterized protein n=1 Tax=Aphanomyces astaci TaxID=112090 RepID=W4FWG0_APHAT|nr:hypothetical protein H257_13414 [Aphanomyces astaci]ETV71276.1 hypothetical protein H257_13414 [Aphanomyces astaci]|eukprot:XP_009839216.1 hypothetical protein H257_13414 [Aphanomyces astaci]